MAEAQELVQRLSASQNPDGGWSYTSGTSWAEPTAYALLALQSAQVTATVLTRGVSWLLSRQQRSGGWSPNPSVEECTSVTSIATLALLPTTSKSTAVAIDSALNWTASQVYRDDLSLSMLISRALHLPPVHAPGSVPWYPGTAGWVMPTSLSALALMRASRDRARTDLRDIARTSCSYLLSRRCVDHGWNHGGSANRSEDATSYPETTGMALLALRAAAVMPPDSSFAIAKQFAGHPESMEGLAWLQMALHSSSDPIPDPKPLPVLRTTRDMSLRLLALAAKSGHNILLGT